MLGPNPDKVPQFKQVAATQARVLYAHRVLVNEILDCCSIYNPVECPECYGGGFEMRCYGGPPVEVQCEYCYGEGFVEDWSEENEENDRRDFMLAYYEWKGMQLREAMNSGMGGYDVGKVTIV